MTLNFTIDIFRPKEKLQDNRLEKIIVVGTLYLDPRFLKFWLNLKGYEHTESQEATAFSNVHNVGSKFYFMKMTYLFIAQKKKIVETRNCLFHFDAILATLIFLKSSCDPSDKEKYQELLNIFPDASSGESSEDDVKVLKSNIPPADKVIFSIFFYVTKKTIVVGIEVCVVLSFNVN